MASDVSLVEMVPCYLHCLESLGRADDAVETVRSALAYHPPSAVLQGELGCAYYYASDYTNSIAAYCEAVRLDPNDFFSYWGLARAYSQLGEYAKAIECCELADGMEGGEWSGLRAELAYAYGRKRDTDKAIEVVKGLQQREMNTEYVDPYIYAMIYVGLSHADARYLDDVFDKLEACPRGSGWLPSLNTDPKFAHLRDHSRFQGLVKKLKFEPTVE